MSSKRIIIKSTYSEKLLGIHVASDFNWKIHVDKLLIDLNKKIGQMRRMVNKIPRGKLL